MRLNWCLNSSVMGVICCTLVGFCIWLSCDFTLGQVHGTVLLDGSPVMGVTLVMQPADARPSQATTDENGHYTMRYTAEKYGVRIGEVRVYVDPFSAPVPPRYFQPFETLQIHFGENVFDLNMTTSVVQTRDACTGESLVSTLEH